MMQKNTEPHFDIIDTADNVPAIVHLRDFIMTIIVWLIYLYFMRDAFFFFGDLLSWAFHGFADIASYRSFRVVHDFLGYFVVIDILGLSFFFWSQYNLLRFGKKKRRRQPQPVPIDEVAAWHAVDPHDIKHWHRTRTLVMHHNDDGQLVKVVEG